MLITIDGAEHLGTYRGQCECGATWHGSAEKLPDGTFAPLMPVAESIVHMKLEHGDTRADVVFAPRFRLWLQAYWAQANRRDAIRFARTPVVAKRVDLT
jgi:hypothetical protein